MCIGVGIERRTEWGLDNSYTREITWNRRLEESTHQSTLKVFSSILSSCLSYIKSKLSFSIFTFEIMRKRLYLNELLKLLVFCMRKKLNINLDMLI